MHAVKRSKALYHLNLSSTAIGSKGAKRIFRGLKHNESIVYLSLGCVDGVYRNRIGFKGVLELQSMLQVNKVLAIIDLSHNRIMNEGFKVLIEAIQNLENVVSLNLCNNEITSEGLEEVKLQIMNTSIQVLDLANNPINNEGLEVLLPNLKTKYKGKIIKLNLASCGFTHKILGRIFPVLAKNKYLRCLVLDHNNFEKDGFLYLKEGLRNNVALKYFSMSMCKIDDEGVRSLGESISTAANLKTLILSHNLITVSKSKLN